MSAPTVKVNIVTTVYPAPDFDGHDADYLPDGESELEARDMTFSELALLLIEENVIMPSSWPPPQNPGPHDWLSCEPSQDYRTGEWTERSVHFSHENPRHLEKYWRKAWQAAGVIRGAA